mgnify:CR=1 FL=1
MDAPEIIAAEPENQPDQAGSADAVASAEFDPGASGLAAKGGGPERFDFRHPAFLSSAGWRKLRMEVEEFVEATGALLSTYLRLDFGLQLGKLHTLAFSEWTGSLASPTHLVLFKADPLRGICVAEIRSAIAQAVVDRLLGGPGAATAEQRILTDMESALMDQFVQLVLEEWCKQWSKLQRLEAQILGHETNPKFLQCAKGDRIMLLLDLEVRMGETEGRMQLAFPYASLEPLINKLTELSADSTPAPAASVPLKPKWARNLDNVPVRLQAQWPAMKLPTRTLLGLQVGSVLDLKAEDAERLELRIGNVTKFRGRLGTRDQKWAIQITETCKL